MRIASCEGRFALFEPVETRQRDTCEAVKFRLPLAAGPFFRRVSIPPCCGESRPARPAALRLRPTGRDRSVRSRIAPSRPASPSRRHATASSNAPCAVRAAPCRKCGSTMKPSRCSAASASAASSSVAMPIPVRRDRGEAWRRRARLFQAQRVSNAARPMPVLRY